MMKKRIHYHDTDTSGAVYHANYLKYLEEARAEYLEERGFTVKGLLEKGVGFAVRGLQVEYKFPAFYADTLDVKVWVKEFTAYRIVFAYTVHNQDGKLILKAETDLVCVGRDLHLVEVPAEIKASLEREKAA
jgi:acyl-CoA thioester hydrolase